MTVILITDVWCVVNHNEYVCIPKNTEVFLYGDVIRIGEYILPICPEEYA